MVYADYVYYTETFGGKMINEADFLRLSRLASAYIDQITFGNAQKATDEIVLYKLKDACCAVCECLQTEENGGEIASATNDGYSESYVTSGKTAEQKKYETARTFLSSTGLLYAGVRRCCRC